MKHRLQTLLKHKLQWLVLLTALLGVSQGMWADDWCGSYARSWNGSSNTGYDIDGCSWVGEASSTSINGQNFGTIGSTFSIDFQALSNSSNRYSNGLFHYQIDSGSWSDIVLSSDGDYSGNKKYKAYLNIAGLSLSAGNHTITFCFRYPHYNDNWWSSNYSFSFTVPSTCTAPTPTTANTPSAKGTTTATLTGTYPTTSGYCSITEKGICYGTSSNPTTKYSDSSSSSGNISKSITGLSEGTTYHYRAYVVSGGTTLYGADKSFTTNCTASRPTLSGTPPNADNITCSSATLGGQVTNKGKDASCNTLDLTYRGVKVYSNSACTDAYLVTTVNHATPNSTDAYTVTVPSGTLSSGTTYYYKSYATNATGTSYSTNYKSFTTKSSVTSVTTGGASSLTLNTGASEAVTSNTTYSMTISPSGAGDYWSFSVSPTPFTGANTITNATGSSSSNINFRREGQYTVTGGAGCGSADKTGTFTVNVYPGTLYVAGPLVNNSWAVTPASQTMSKTGSGTSSVYTYEWTAPSDFVAGSSSVEGGEFTVQSVTNMSLPNYILPAYCPADPSTYTNIYRVTNTTNHNLRCTFAVSSGDKLKLRVAYNGTTGSPKAPYYTFTLNKVPVPTTGDVTDITWTQAKLWGTYPKTSEYEEVTSRGFYYGTTSSPGTKVLNGAQSAGSIAKTITGLTPGTTYYYKAFVVSGGVEYYGSVESFTTTVCSNPTVSTQPSTTAREYCKDEASPASLTVVATGGVGEYTYQWKQCATSGGTYTNVSAGSGGTTDTYTPSTATAGGLYYKCVVTNSGICTSNSVTSNASGKYTIDAASVGGSISGGSTSVCPGTTKNLTLGSYTGSIQWHSSSESGFTPSSTTAISGATSATYAAPISTAGTKYYKAVVKNGVCAAATSSQSYLTVKRSAVAGDYTLTNNAQTYNGSARAVTVTPASGAGAATVYYTGTGSTTYAKSTTAPTNAGSYSITIDAAAGDDYCAATNLTLGTDSIKKATQSTLTISNTITSLVYCDDASVTLTTTGGSGSGAVTYAVTSGSGSVDGDVLSPSARGSVTVVADKAASANYLGIKSAAKTFNFTVDAPTVYTLSNVGGATTICGDPSTGAGSGTLRLANSQTGYNYQLYSNGSPVEGYAAKAGTTGSSIDFPVTSSGTYTVYAYYGTNSTNCATQMDGEITLTISTQPKLVRSAASVTEYMPVTITSVSTDIAEWKIVDGSGNDVSSSTAYLFDQTYDAITFKGASTDASTPKTYTIKATTAGGCSETTTVTVNPDTESCGS